MAEQGNRPRQQGMKPIRAVLAAGVAKSWEVSGDYFHVYAAPVADLVVRFDDGEPNPMEQGVGIRRYYDRITLESATGQTVDVRCGFGTVQDGRAAVTGLTLNTQIAPGNTFDDGGDVSVPDSAVTQLCAADPDRLYANIDVPSDAVGAVRVGTATVDLTKGRRIEPGMSVPIASTAALYAYHENGAAVVVSVSAVKEV